MEDGIQVVSSRRLSKNAVGLPGSSLLAKRRRSRSASVIREAGDDG